MQIVGDGTQLRERTSGTQRNSKKRRQIDETVIGPWKSKFTDYINQHQQSLISRNRYKSVQVETRVLKPIPKPVFKLPSPSRIIAIRPKHSSEDKPIFSHSLNKQKIIRQRSNMKSPLNILSYKFKKKIVQKQAQGSPATRMRSSRSLTRLKHNLQCKILGEYRYLNFIGLSNRKPNSQPRNLENLQISLARNCISKQSHQHSQDKKFSF